MRVLAAFWAWYLTKLKETPLKTKAITAAVCGLITEWVVNRVKLLSGTKLEDLGSYAQFWVGVLRQALIGAFFKVPIMHLWSTLLNNKIFPATEAALAAPAQTTIKKVLVHEAIYDPCFSFCYLFLLRAIDGFLKDFPQSLSSFNQVITDGKEVAVAEFPNAMKTQWSIWPIVHVMTYGAIPPELQVGFVNFVGIFTNAALTYFSMKKKRASADQH